MCNQAGTSPAVAPSMKAVKPDVLPTQPGNGACATEPTMDGRTMQMFFSFRPGCITCRSDRFFARKYLDHRRLSGPLPCNKLVRPGGTCCGSGHTQQLRPKRVTHVFCSLFLFISCSACGTGSSCESRDQIAFIYVHLPLSRLMLLCHTKCACYWPQKWSLIQIMPVVRAADHVACSLHEALQLHLLLCLPWRQCQ